MPATKLAKRKKPRGVLNALRHGIRTDRVLPSEKRAFAKHEALLLQDLKPQGPLEEHLARRIALLLWRLHRLERWETAEIERAQEFSQHFPDTFLPRDGKPVTVAMPGPEALEKLQRYESHLERCLYRALHELEAQQERRKGNPAPLARLEVHGVSFGTPDSTTGA